LEHSVQRQRRQRAEAHREKPGTRPKPKECPDAARPSESWQ
jgi:hypothetical protein